eukprot:365774-Chlamydomonas_euryale.AAC.3
MMWLRSLSNGTASMHGSEETAAGSYMLTRFVTNHSIQRAEKMAHPGQSCARANFCPGQTKAPGQITCAQGKLSPELKRTLSCKQVLQLAHMLGNMRWCTVDHTGKRAPPLHSSSTASAWRRTAGAVLVGERDHVTLPIQSVAIMSGRSGNVDPVDSTRLNVVLVTGRC